MIIRLEWQDGTYGGSEFLDIIDNKEFRTGNTASTKTSLTESRIPVTVKKLRELKIIANILRGQGLKDLGRM